MAQLLPVIFQCARYDSNSKPGAHAVLGMTWGRRHVVNATILAVLLNLTALENGGEKVDHGSGGIVLLRAE